MTLSATITWHFRQAKSAALESQNQPLAASGGGRGRTIHRGGRGTAHVQLLLRLSVVVGAPLPPREGGVAPASTGA